MLKNTLSQILIIGCLFLSKIAIAQSDTTRNNNLYIELFGNGMTSTVNYDHIFGDESPILLSTRIGLGYKSNFLGRGKDILSVPVEMTMLIKILEKVNCLELGWGYTLTNFSDDYEDYNVGYMTLRIGYRYQDPDEWFMMRAGIIPMYDLYISKRYGESPNKTWNLMAGLSVGLTF